MFKYCENKANNYVNLLCIKLIGFTHKPQNIFSFVIYTHKMSIFKLTVNNLLHNLFIHFISVKERFYTIYTAPTITTTYNK